VSSQFLVLLHDALDVGVSEVDVRIFGHLGIKFIIIVLKYYWEGIYGGRGGGEWKCEGAARQKKAGKGLDE
jgi:hypothetical protein